MLINSRRKNGTKKTDLRTTKVTSTLASKSTFCRLHGACWRHNVDGDKTFTRGTASARNRLKRWWVMARREREREREREGESRFVIFQCLHTQSRCFIYVMCAVSVERLTLWQKCSQTQSHSLEHVNLKSPFWIWCHVSAPCQKIPILTAPGIGNGVWVIRVSAPCHNIGSGRMPHSLTATPMKRYDVTQLKLRQLIK